MLLSRRCPDQFSALRVVCTSAPRAPWSVNEAMAAINSSRSALAATGPAWMARRASLHSQRGVIAASVCRITAVPGRVAARNAKVTSCPSPPPLATRTNRWVSSGNW